VTFKAENFESHIRGSFSKDELHTLATSKIFISGGTGFAGRWIISTLGKLFKSQDLPPIVIVSRSPRKARTVFKNYGNIEITDWENLNKSTVLGPHKKRVIAFHASVPAASGVEIKFAEIDSYGKQTEFFASTLGKEFRNPLFVNLSSGAVYERPTSGKIPEKQIVKETTAMNSYDLVKINDERIVAEMTQANIIIGTNPRLFSFSGPGIDIPGNFALGSFVNDALQGRAVQVTGSGSSERSYMSPIDMGIWILKSSIYPSTDITHIGSSLGLKMPEIAQLVAQIFGNGQVNVSNEQGLVPESYVPETQFTESLFQIQDTINIERSLKFWRGKTI
jgi:nucleoside-diphosphate-sugar epimerase